MIQSLLSTVYPTYKVSMEEYPPCYSMNNNLVDSLQKEISKETLEFISENIDLRNFSNILLTTKTKAYIESLDFDNIRAIINLKKLNNIKNINNHLKAVNKLLPDAGIYIGRTQTYSERKIKIYNKFGRKAGKIIWMGDFILNRVLPRMKPFKKIYHFLTKSKFHTTSLAELLGRLVYCGFDIIDYKTIHGLLYFIVLKTKDPSTNSNPTFHPLVRLQRIGKNGRLVAIYKMRTMHPYSEYIQDFVIRMNGYNKYGKPANDFRLTRWGKFFRKYWLDEIPQLLNFIKGEISLVGVRPLSKARFNELPPDIQKIRVNFKPGLIPPYVSLNMSDDKGNIEAERIYIKEKLVSPIKTDVKFFFMAIFNILTGKIRSA